MNGLRSFQTEDWCNSATWSFGGGGVFMTTQIARNEVVYSILLSEVNNPLSRKEVERRFESELLKK